MGCSSRGPGRWAWGRCAWYGRCHPQAAQPRPRLVPGRKGEPRQLRAEAGPRPGLPTRRAPDPRPGPPWAPVHPGASAHRSQRPSPSRPASPSARGGFGGCFERCPHSPSRWGDPWPACRGPLPDPPGPPRPRWCRMLFMQHHSPAPGPGQRLLLGSEGAWATRPLPPAVPCVWVGGRGLHPGRGKGARGARLPRPFPATLTCASCHPALQGLKQQTQVKLNIVSCPPVTTVLIKRPDLKYQLGFSVQNGIVSPPRPWPHKPQRASLAAVQGRARRGQGPPHPARPPAL